MTSIDDLQTQLAEKIAKLDEERRENAEKFERERKQLLEFASMERAKQLEEYNKKIEEHARRQAQKEAEEKARQKKEQEDRILLEQKQNSVDEALRLQREKLEWLETAITNAEFLEEQHRKSLENQRMMMANPEVAEEGGKACEASLGTEGSTPETPLMSVHLKGILRQVQRNY